MTVAEQVDKLTLEIADPDEYIKLEQSLKEYKQMISAGILSPRGNMVQSLYNPVYCRSNYS